MSSNWTALLVDAGGETAEQVDVVERLLTQAGFEDVQVAPKEDSKTFMAEWAPDTPITDYVASATIEAARPAAKVSGNASNYSGGSARSTPPTSKGAHRAPKRCTAAAP